MNALALIQAAVEPAGSHRLSQSFRKLRERLLVQPTSVTLHGIRYNIDAPGDEHVELGPAIQITCHGHKGTCVFCSEGKIVAWDFDADEIYPVSVPESASPQVLLQNVLKFVSGPKPVRGAVESETQADKTRKVVEALERIPYGHGKLHKIAPYLFVNAGSVSFTSSYAAPKLNNVDAKLLFEISSDEDTSSARTRQYFEVYAHLAWSMDSGELHLRRLCAEHQCEAPLQHCDVRVTGLTPAGVVNKITALASRYVIDNAKHILNGLVHGDARFESARQHYAGNATAAVEPAKSESINEIFDELRNRLRDKSAKIRVGTKPITVQYGLEGKIEVIEEIGNVRHVCAVGLKWAGTSRACVEVSKRTGHDGVYIEHAKDARDLLNRILHGYASAPMVSHAAAEPQPTNNAAHAVVLFRELMKKLPRTDVDKRVRERKPVHVNGLDVVVLAHEADESIRFHIIEDGKDTCGYADIGISSGKACVRAELHGLRLARHNFTTAKDTRDLLRQLLAWFTKQYKVHQEQLESINFRSRA